MWRVTNLGSKSYPVLASLHVERCEVVLGSRNAVPWAEEPGRCIDTGTPLQIVRHTNKNKYCATCSHRADLIVHIVQCKVIMTSPAGVQLNFTLSQKINQKSSV